MSKPHIRRVTFYGDDRVRPYAMWVLFVDRKASEMDMSWIGRARSIRQLSQIVFRMRK